MHLLPPYPPQLKNVTTLPCKMQNFYILLRIMLRSSKCWWLWKEPTRPSSPVDCRQRRWMAEINFFPSLSRLWHRHSTKRCVLHYFNWCIDLSWEQTIIQRSLQSMHGCSQDFERVGAPRGGCRISGSGGRWRGRRPRARCIGAKRRGVRSGEGRRSPSPGWGSGA